MVVVSTDLVLLILKNINDQLTKWLVVTDFIRNVNTADFLHFTQDTEYGYLCENKLLQCA